MTVSARDVVAALDGARFLANTEEALQFGAAEVGIGQDVAREYCDLSGPLLQAVLDVLALPEVGTDDYDYAYSFGYNNALSAVRAALSRASQPGVKS